MLISWMVFRLETEASIWSSPIIYNENKIAFANNDNKLFIVDGSGEILLTKEVSSNIVSSLIAFEQNSGDFLIVYNTLAGSLGIIDEAGNILENWPQNVGATTSCSPIAVDIDDDGQIDIFSSTISNYFMGYSAGGELLSAFPVINPYGLTSPLSVGDLDCDGDFEITCGDQTGVAVWDYKQPKGSITPCAIYRGNIRRTGNYGDNNVYKNDDELQLEMRYTLKQNYPNPFSSSTNIAFNIPANSSGAVRIQIFNIRGQLIKTIESEESIAPGNVDQTYSVVWNGEDEDDNQVSTGIYFYKLLTKNKPPQVKKLLLIR